LQFYEANKLVISSSVVDLEIPFGFERRSAFKKSGHNYQSGHNENDIARPSIDFRFIIT